MTLNYIKRVFLDVFSRCKPRFSIGIFCTADSNSFSLTKGVVGQTDMLSHNLSVRGFNWARFVAQITVKELAEGPFPDKTDTRAVFFTGVRQSDFRGDFANLSLAVAADWE